MDVWRQFLILRKFEADCSLTACVAGRTNKNYKTIITQLKYSSEFHDRCTWNESS